MTSMALLSPVAAATSVSYPISSFAKGSLKRTGSCLRLVSVPSFTSLQVPSQKLRGIVMAGKTDLDELVSQSVKMAQEVCAEDAASGECVVAWEEVEELSAARAHKKVAAESTKDPLEAYCKDNPETDECRVYED